MTDLSTITFDEIESKIKLVLIGNQDYKLTQYTIYNKVIDHLDLNTTFISQAFKAKFLLVLRNLQGKNSDIEINIENGIYTAIYYSSNSKISNGLINEQINSNMQFTKDDFNNYIIENDLINEFSYQDPAEGNTIYHDIVNGNNYFSVKKLIKSNLFNYTIQNNYGKTPIDMINSQEMTNIFINKLSSEIVMLKSRITYLETKDINLEINITKCIELKFIRFIEKNFNTIILGLSASMVATLVFGYYCVF